jgi:hypothetical protein
MWTWMTMLWMGLGLSPAAAQDLLSSKVDPRMLLDGFDPAEQDVKKVEETLLRYAKGSKYVVIGEVTHVDRRVSGSVLDREATIEVISWMRGDGDFSISVVMPYNAPYIDTDWSTVPGILVKGYSVVIFLDDQMRVVEGNGLFYTDGEYLWRNKRSELFLHPHYDREWMSQEQNPYDDYVVIPLTDVSQILATQRPAKWLR